MHQHGAITADDMTNLSLSCCHSPLFLRPVVREFADIDVPLLVFIGCLDQHRFAIKQRDVDKIRVMHWSRCVHGL